MGVQKLTAFLLAVILALGVVPVLPIFTEEVEAATTNPYDIKVSTGENITFILKGGNLYAMGRDRGQYGGSTDTSYTPVMIDTSSVGNIVDISSARMTILLLNDKGEVYTAGTNDTSFGTGIFSTLGTAGSAIGTQVRIFTKIDFPAGAGKIVKLNGGADARFNCAVLDENGVAYAWGSNEGYALGIGDETNGAIFTPKKVIVENDQKLKDIAVGRYGSIAIGTDNKLYVAGQPVNIGESGSVLKKTFEKSTTFPPDVIPAKISAIASSSMVLGTDGEIYITGNGFNGQLGNGTDVPTREWVNPIKPVGVTSWVDAVNGFRSVMAKGNNGVLYAWGVNQTGHLGVGNLENQLMPKPVLYENGDFFYSGGSFTMGGFSNSAVVDNKGEIYTFGYIRGSGHGNENGFFTNAKRLLLNNLEVDSIPNALVFKTEDNPNPVKIVATTQSHLSATGDIIKTEWFRISGRDATTYTNDTYSDKFNLVSDANKGEMTFISGTSEAKSYEIDVSENGRYWMRTTYRNNNSPTDVSYQVRSIYINNIYTRPNIYVKGIDNTSSEIIHGPEIYDGPYYGLELNNGPFGVAYNLDSTTDILSSTADSNTIVNNTNINNQKFANIVVQPKNLNPYYFGFIPPYTTIPLSGVGHGYSEDDPITYRFDRDNPFWKTFTYQGIDESGEIIPGFSADPPSDTFMHNLQEATLTPPSVTGYTAIGYKIANKNAQMQPFDGNGNAVIPGNISTTTILYVYTRDTSGISGKVTIRGTENAEFPDGIPYANAQIVFIDKTDTTKKYKATTTVNGGYHIDGVPTGDYMVTTNPSPFRGFEPYEVDAVVGADALEHNIKLVIKANTGVSYITVVNEEGVRQPNATVFVNGETYFTGANGRTLAIELPVPGTHIAMVSKPGFKPAKKEIVLQQTDIYNNIEVKLSMGDNFGGIWGHVTDENKNPLEGVTVKTLSGLTATTDSNGFYVIVDVTTVKNNVVATKAGYNTGYAVVSVFGSRFTPHNFVLMTQTQGNEMYTVSGKVTDKKTGTVIKGATVTSGTNTVSTDDSGFYLIGDFRKGSNNDVEASSNLHTSSKKSILDINKDETLNFELSQSVKTTVIGFSMINGLRNELYRYELTNDYSATDTIDITSNRVPTYKIVNQTTGTAFPAFRTETVSLDTDSEVLFEYQDNMSSVDIKACLKDTTDPIEEFEEFSIITEAGYPFSFTTAPNIIGYTYKSSSGDIASVKDDGTDSVIFYYTRNENPTKGKFSILAMDKDTNEIIGQIENNSLVNKDDTFNATDENAPKNTDIPNLANYKLVQGSGTPTSTTYNGIDSPNNVTYKYERLKRTYVVERWDTTTGTKIDVAETFADKPVGNLYEVSRPEAPLGYVPLAGSDNQFKFMLEDGNDNYVVKFYYTQNGLAQINVKAVCDDGTAEVDIPGYSSTLTGIFGTNATVDAPVIPGYLLDSQRSVTKTFGIDTEIKFVYIKRMITVKVEYREDSKTGTKISEEIIFLPKDVASTIVAKPINGYIIQPPYAYTQVFTAPTTKVFVYKKVQDVVNEENIDVTIKGMAGTKELYSYVITKLKNSGEFEVSAFDVNKYALTDPTLSPATIPTDGSVLAHTFNYDSLETTVKVSTVLDTDENVNVPGTTPIEHSAIKGQPYIAYAPYISGYNLVGNASKTITSVKGTAEDDIKFIYTEAAGNVGINLVDSENGKIIKTVNENVTIADGEKLIEIPDLTDDHYTVKEGQTAKKVSYSTTMQTVTYEYVKDKRKVEVFTVYNGVETSIYENDYNVDSIQTILAPIPPVGAKLDDVSSKNVLVVKDTAGEGNLKVYFNYTEILQGDVVVNAVLTGVPNTIIQTFTVSTAVGNEVTVKAPVIQGYKLKDENDIKTGASPTTIEFLYEKDEVTVTVSYKSNGVSIQPDATFNVKKGDDLTVYTPYKNGYVLIGKDSHTFEKLTENDSHTFNYTKIEVPQITKTDLNITFKDIDGGNLGQDLVKNLEVGSNYAYTYPSLDSAGYIFNSSTPLNDGLTISITLAENGNEIIVFYEKKKADVIVNHYNFETNELLETETITDQKVGTLYIASYYDENNYLYHSGNTQKLVIVGENIINIYYTNKTDIPAGSVIIKHVVEGTGVILKTEIISNIRTARNDKMARNQTIDEEILETDELLNNEDGLVTNEASINEVEDIINEEIITYDVEEIVIEEFVSQNTDLTRALTEPYEYITADEPEVLNIKNLGYEIFGGDTTHIIPLNETITISYIPKAQGVKVEYYDVTNNTIIETLDTAATLNTVFLPYIKYFMNYTFASIEPQNGVVVANGINTIRVNYTEIVKPIEPEPEPEPEPEKVPAIVTVKYTSNGNVIKTENLNGYFVKDSLTYTASRTIIANGRSYSLLTSEVNPKTLVLATGINTLEFKYNEINSGGGGSGGGGGSSGGGGGNKPTPKPEVKPTPNPIIEPNVDVYTDKLGLEMIQHIKYIDGYMDGTFKPQKSLTRAEAVTMFYNLSTVVDKSKSYNKTYSDVSEDSWYFKQIEMLSEIGIINGYPDGTFRPNEKISRAEFVTIISKIKDTIGNYEPIYEDVKSDHWASIHITIASKNNWVKGYEDNLFKPNNKITRAEAVTTINNVLDRKITKDEISEISNPYFDIDTAHWAYKNIVEASTHHDYHRLEDGTERWKFN